MTRDAWAEYDAWERALRRPTVSYPPTPGEPFPDEPHVRECFDRIGLSSAGSIYQSAAGDAWHVWDGDGRYLGEFDDHDAAFSALGIPGPRQ